MLRIKQRAWDIMRKNILVLTYIPHRITPRQPHHIPPNHTEPHHIAPGHTNTNASMTDSRTDLRNVCCSNRIVTDIAVGRVSMAPTVEDAGCTADWLTNQCLQREGIRRHRMSLHTQHNTCPAPLDSGHRQGWSAGEGNQACSSCDAFFG